MNTKLFKLVSGLVCALSLAVPQSHAQAAGTKTISFVSDTNWRVYKSDPAQGHARSIGRAQAVCVNPRVPVSCPAGALNYGLVYPPGYDEIGWTADRTTIPGSIWVWAPNIDPLTTPANLQDFYFSRKFNVNGNMTKGAITSATISVAADDFVEVIVNGVVVGSHGSVVDIFQAAQAQNNLATFNVMPFLVRGENTITIHAQNGPSYFASPGCEPCTYNINAAGVVFGGQITFARDISILERVGTEDND